MQLAATLRATLRMYFWIGYWGQAPMLSLLWRLRQHVTEIELQEFLNDLQYFGLGDVWKSMQKLGKRYTIMEASSPLSTSTIRYSGV